MFDNAELKNFIAANLEGNPADLALKYSGKVDFDLRFALDQIEGRKKAQKKLPLFCATENFCFPTGISLEQSSSQATALYKQSICRGKNLIDITGGFGVDAYFMSGKFDYVVYCESNEKLAQQAAYNFDLLGAENIECHGGDGIAYLQEQQKTFDWLYVDPSRRSDKKGKVFFIEDCLPNVQEHLPLLLEKAKRVLIKFSPLLDLQHIIETLPGVEQIHIVSVKNECKELLVEVSSPQGKEREGSVTLTCINLLANEKLERFEEVWSERKQTIATSGPLNFIYEANRSIMKAGLQDKLAQGLDFKKLATHSHFFTSDHFMEWFPGRVFKLLQMLSLDANAIADALTDQKANIIARNFPMKASEIYKKYKVVPGGAHYLLASTLSDGKKILLLCERVK